MESIMIIFTKKKQDDKYEIKTLGHKFLIEKDELLKYVATEQLFYKANHPVTDKNVIKYL